MKVGIILVELNGNLFDWDINKNLSNIQKHGVTFKEAASAFQDEDAIYFDDTNHSKEEDRFIIIGKSKIDRLLYVCHCYRESETIIRIISARRATENETKLYGGAI